MITGSKRTNWDIYAMVEDIKKQPEVLQPALVRVLSDISSHGLPDSMPTIHCQLYWDLSKEIARLEYFDDPRAEIVRDNRFSLLYRYFSSNTSNKQ